MNSKGKTFNIIQLLTIWGGISLTRVMAIVSYIIYSLTKQVYVYPCNTLDEKSPETVQLIFIKPKEKWCIT